MKSLSQRAFTLLELMLAMVVTVFLVMMLAKTLDVTTLAIKGSQRMLDANRRACFALDRMGLDLKKIVLRNDVQPFFKNRPLGKENARFLAMMKGPNSDRSVSLISYRLSEKESGLPSLQRGVRGFQWGDVGFMGLNSDGSPTDLMKLPQKIDIRQQDYEDLVDGILQWAICFQYKSDGKVYLDPPNATILEGSTNHVTSGNEIVQRENTASIIIGLVLVDFKNTPVANPEHYQALASLFTLPPDGVTPQAHWQSILDGALFKEKIAEGIPKQLSSSLRIYQRFYPIESF